MWKKLAILTLLPGCALLFETSPEPLSRSTILEQDFGRIAAGVSVARIFRVGNPSAAPLGLRVRTSSCSCSVSLGETAIIAGGRAEVRVELETAELVGNVVQIAELETTDPERPTLSLVLRGEVVPPVRADPQVLYFGRINRGARVFREISLKPGSSDVKILRVTSASGTLRLLRLAGNAPPGAATSTPAEGELRIRVSWPQDLLPGGHEDRLVVETTSRELPRFEVPALVIVRE